MLIHFEKISDNARVWIYQAEKSLTDKEIDSVSQKTEQFLKQWQAHGQDIKASFVLKYNQFLIVAADESFSQASGCSIDALVHLVKTLEKELQISFMTSGKMAFLQLEEINLYAFNQLKSKIEKKIIQPETLVFDNTIQNVGDFKKKWLMKSKETWVGKYF